MSQTTIVQGQQLKLFYCEEAVEKELGQLGLVYLGIGERMVWSSSAFSNVRRPTRINSAVTDASPIESTVIPFPTTEQLPVNLTGRRKHQSTSLSKVAPIQAWSESDDHEDHNEIDSVSLYTRPQSAPSRKKSSPTKLIVVGRPQSAPPLQVVNNNSPNKWAPVVQQSGHATAQRESFLYSVYHAVIDRIPRGFFGSTRCGVRNGYTNGPYVVFMSPIYMDTIMIY
jgi:hypothetical protein